MQFEDIDLEENKHRTLEVPANKKMEKIREDSESEEDAFELKSHSANSRFKRKQSIYVPEKTQ